MRPVAGTFSLSKVSFFFPFLPSFLKNKTRLVVSGLYLLLVVLWFVYHPYLISMIGGVESLTDYFFMSSTLSGGQSFALLFFCFSVFLHYQKFGGCMCAGWDLLCYYYSCNCIYCLHFLVFFVCCLGD